MRAAKMRRWTWGLGPMRGVEPCLANRRRVLENEDISVNTSKWSHEHIEMIMSIWWKMNKIYLQDHIKMTMNSWDEWSGIRTRIYEDSATESPQQHRWKQRFLSHLVQNTRTPFSTTDFIFRSFIWQCSRGWSEADLLFDDRVDLHIGLIDFQKGRYHFFPQSKKRKSDMPKNLEKVQTVQTPESNPVTASCAWKAGN